MKDYYEILQVHPKAEPEVIEGAYKKLAQKYHPDKIEGGASDEKMKALNEAYAILKSPESRGQYDAQRQSHVPQRKASSPIRQGDDIFQATQLMRLYLSHIRKKKYKDAYELLSVTDRQMVTFDAFNRWQEAVAGVYTLEKFHFKPEGVEANVFLGSRRYKSIVRMTVMTEAYNGIMDTIECDRMAKVLVKEKRQWRVYMGGDATEALSKRYEVLSALKTIKREVTESVVPEKEVLPEALFMYTLKMEALRCERYRRTFSVLCIRLEARDAMAMRAVTAEVKNVLRRLDAIGTDGGDTLMILLPETGRYGALKVGEKIKNRLEGIGNTSRGALWLEAFQGDSQEVIRRLNGVKKQPLKQRGLQLCRL